MKEYNLLKTNVPYCQQCTLL